MEVFAKETRRRLSSVLSDFGIEIDGAEKEKRQYFEDKYEHTRKKNAVQALKKWKKERMQYLLNEVPASNENLLEKNNSKSTDACRRSTMTTQIRNMYQFPNKSEKSQRSHGRNKRFSTGDVNTVTDTFAESKCGQGVKKSISFQDTEQLQRSYKRDEHLKHSRNTTCSGEQDSLQKLNRHWKVLKESVLSNIQKHKDRRISVDELSTDQQVANGGNQCQTLKRNFRKALEEADRLRQKSVDAWSNIKEKCQTCCSNIGFSDRSSFSASSANTEKTDLSSITLRIRSRLEDVKVFPFCAEYDGYTSRRTKTISESIQAILEERKKQEEAALREEIERQVSYILAMRMLYKSEDESGAEPSIADQYFTDKTNYVNNETYMYENDDSVEESETDKSKEDPIDWVSGTYLNLNIEHSESTNELSVTISSIDNLYSLTDTWNHFKVYITASLMPRKGSRKQKTKTQKGYDTVEFHENLYFGNLKGDVDNYSIRFKVYQITHFLACSSTRCIGEATLWLEDVDLNEKDTVRVEILSFI